jgi:hypothetical protein
MLSKNYASDTVLSNLIISHEKISVVGIIIKFSFMINFFRLFEFKKKIPLLIISKVILTFFEPAGFVLIIPRKLLVKNLVVLIGCQFLKFLVLS